MATGKGEAPPTYEIEPSEFERFYPSKVRDVIRKEFEKALESWVYDPAIASTKATELTQSIRERVKNGAPGAIPRYKVLVQVIIGEVKGQGLKIMSQCLWDEKVDNFASETYKTVRNE